MDRLSSIPIRIAGTPAGPVSNDRLSPVGLAILSEIEKLLGDYQAFGHAGAIDLRWLPLLPGDLDRLKEILGTGEVRATMDALGASTVQETAIQCVWWVTHRGSDDALLGDWIEVTEVPSILRSDRAAIPYALQALHERAMSFGGAITNEPDAQGGKHHD